jgi:hypothetical protein
VTLEHRQNPAVLVVPVLTPRNPCQSSRFVLYQVVEYAYPHLLVMLQVYDFELTISASSGRLRIIAPSLPMFYAVDLLPFTARPCGLAYFVCFSPRKYAVRFISSTKQLIAVFPMRYDFGIISKILAPTVSLITTAASFPLGNISPYIRSISRTVSY